MDFFDSFLEWLKQPWFSSKSYASGFLHLGLLFFLIRTTVLQARGNAALRKMNKTLGRIEELLRPNP